MNPWRAPRWIVRNHAEDEFAKFNADALPAGANGMPREPGPIQLEAGPVPSHNGLRLNENQCLPPPEPEAPHYHPEKSVGNSKPRMRTPPFQDSKLLPESQILQKEIAARTKEHDHRNKQQLHQAQHARSCTRRQSALDTGLIVMIQQQIAILANDRCDAHHCVARERVESSPLGIPNPDRRRPQGSFPRGQNPTASICVTPPLLADVRALWRLCDEIPDLCHQHLCH